MNNVCNFIKNNYNNTINKTNYIKWNNDECFTGDFIELKISLYIKSKLFEYLGNDIKDINFSYKDDNIIISFSYKNNIIFISDKTDIDGNLFWEIFMY